MTLPNFLVIGAGKSGTTSLYHYLMQHPDVYTSAIKETNFFAYEGQKRLFDKHWVWRVTSMADYHAQFRGAREETAIGEVSPRYLRTPSAAPRIAEHIPHAKLIVMLRQPAERAHSSYCMHIRNGTERRDFATAVEHEMSGASRLKQGARDIPYLQPGFYYRHLSHYLRYFGRDQMAIFLYDDFRTNPERIMSNIFDFIGVDSSFVPDMTIRYNAGGVPRSKALQFLLKPRGITSELRARLPRQFGEYWSAFAQRLQRKHAIGPKPALDPAMRQRLDAYYREDILQLQDLLQRDLSMWFKP